jgi:hypothetical protein
MSTARAKKKQVRSGDAAVLRALRTWVVSLVR